MSWVDDHKGAGPWDFVEQINKYGYVNCKRWSDKQEARAFCLSDPEHLPLNPSTHTPCGHWHKTPASEEEVT